MVTTEPNKWYGVGSTVRPPFNSPGSMAAWQPLWGATPRRVVAAVVANYLFVRAP